MKKVLFGLLAALLLLSSCGYNAIMYDHLSDEANYYTYQVRLLKAYYYDVDAREEISVLPPVDIDVTELPEVLLRVSETLDPSASESSEPENQWDEFSAQLTKENCQILAENGFFEDIAPEEVFEIRYSPFIYMDGEFFFVAEVVYNGKTYLDFDTGLSNIIKMMDGNRTLL